ncbi:Protein-L-isoaspartate O-methyltransferase [Calycomorphotria hydatis]|uniref:Protein-L-isoaspartate O-methyltransferase n=2 Tax=Calycomorphotria hydatis TaxID=2528027 RepID=A0A517T9P6_9PLAN|nr:Protein-L-isoaspartate O-methyltransferase [Calycomorphotria hydatis]
MNDDPKTKLIEKLQREGITDSRVLAAIAAVPREQFLTERLISQAYRDIALPIEEGQTISQPFIVALMTQALKLTPESIVLEIGTGSGYQTAVLAQLCRHVYSVERFPALSVTARVRLSGLGIGNVTLIIGDGTLGIPASAPFDGIIVTAGGEVVPQPLLEQLAPGGRMVIPLGDEESQELKLLESTEGGIQESTLCQCRFVKLIGEHGW